MPIKTCIHGITPKGNCKECTLIGDRVRQKRAYHRNPDKYRLKSRKFFIDNPNYLKNYRDNNKERIIRMQKLNLKKYPKRIKTKYYVQSHIDKLPLDEFCELCPDEDKLKATERHHPDYNYPEIYVSICNSCHAFMRRKTS